MCFGTTIICSECNTPTVYLLPGIHRCSTRNTLAHKITGPSTTSTTCWDCRATRASLENIRSEARIVLSWYEQAQKLFGHDSELLEASSNVLELTSEMETTTDEAVKSELEQLNKAEEERVQELKAVSGRHTKWLSTRNATFIIIAPPGGGAMVPLTFQEWTSRFGGRSAGMLEEWTTLNFDCQKYEEYLEDNGFEYECDIFHAKNAEDYSLERRIFHFDEVKNGKLSLHAWRTKERLGAIKDKEEGLTPRTVAEIFESTLDLYALYLTDAPEDAEVLHELRVSVAKDRRLQLYGLEDLSHEEAQAQIAAIPAPSMAYKDDVPMSFAEWCASPLAQPDLEFNRNTDFALRADLCRYKHYLFRFPEATSIYEEHSKVWNRLRSAYIDDFSSRTTNSVILNRARQPLSLKDFFLLLEEQGYRRLSLEWAGDAYVLYLGSLADESEVGGFTMARDWWARGDRRELEGLPRSDPVAAKLKSVMEWLARYIFSMENEALRSSARVKLSSSLLMLNSYMDQSREPTAEQWQHIRTSFHEAEHLVNSMRALPEQDRSLEAPAPVHSFFEDLVMRASLRDPEPAVSQAANNRRRFQNAVILEIMGSANDMYKDDENNGYDDHYPSHNSPPTMRSRHIPDRGHFDHFDRFDPFGDHPDPDSDNASETEGDDFDRLFDEDHQVVNRPNTPGSGMISAMENPPMAIETLGSHSTCFRCV
ncbi:hypothetical protein N431DRAFT_535205 [Stipitochalara longipes BDJ]|nr:hypothetical protein N431DRAFT_535205 [Stipitochalara longipes BDJ]